MGILESHMAHSKRRLEDTDIDTMLPRKQLRRSPPSLPTPSPTVPPARQRAPRCNTHERKRRGSPLSEPASSPHRTRNEAERERALASKNSQPSLSASASIYNWLSYVPAKRDLVEYCSSTEESAGVIDRPSSSPSIPPLSLPALDQMSQQDGGSIRRQGSMASSQSDRPGPTSRMYRTILAGNNIFMDPLGDAIPAELRELLDARIRRSRSPPPLNDEELGTFTRELKRVWDKPEMIVSDIIRAPVFPIKYPAIAEGRGNPWLVNPLPRKPEYQFGLPLPKPDRSYGYHIGQESDWSDAEIVVVDHREAWPYSQPSKEVYFPFYMIEIKSEASGRTLYVAENQAANSGAHSVRAQRWLHSQANPSKKLSPTDAIAFTATVSQRMVVLHVHWYCPESEKYYMSYIDCFRLKRHADVLEFCNLHLNIQEYGANDLQDSIRESLKALFPIPREWKKGRSTGVFEDAEHETGISEQARSTKTQSL